MADHGHQVTLTASFDAQNIAPVTERQSPGEAFRAYAEQVLAPALSPGDIVILDNLASHKVAGIREAVRAAGASLLYLPPYSPDLDPIEQVFAKLKALLRQVAPRTREILWTTVGRLLMCSTKTELR